MNVKFMPNENSVTCTRKANESLLILISHDGNTVILGDAYTYGEHFILLIKSGCEGKSVDDFFKIIATNSGADWNFTIPFEYKNIKSKKDRAEVFFSDGIVIITKVLTELKFNPKINIPERYQKHLKIFKK